MDYSKSTIVLRKPYQTEEERRTKPEPPDVKFDLGNIPQLEPASMAYLLEGQLNSFSNYHKLGIETGKLMKDMHCTLQSCLVNWALGILVGIQENAYTDARNEVAIRIARKVAALVKEDGLQPLI